MIRSPRLCATAVAGVLAAVLGCPGQAQAAADGECDIVVDPRMPVYLVMVGGAPYRNKRYLTWDDALRLRDVLVSAGTCRRAAGPKPCKLELIAAGNYAVVRDGINFDPYAKLRTRQAAREYARHLERAKLCKPMR
jgi:hypothetical protein